VSAKLYHVRSTLVTGSFMFGFMIKASSLSVQGKRNHTAVHTTSYKCQRKITRMLGKSLNYWWDLWVYSCIIMTDSFHCLLSQQE